MKTDSIPHSLPLPRGLIARVAIHCVCPDTGDEGCFLYSGESHRTKGSRVSLVYPDLAALFQAVRSDWQEVQDGNCAYGYTKR